MTKRATDEYRDDVAPLNTQRSDARKAYARSHPLILCVACASALAGLLMLLDVSPQDTSVGAATHSALITNAWAIMLAAGGGAVLYGVFRLEPVTQSVGLMLLATCYAVATIASAGVARGPFGYIAFGGLAVGHLARAVLVYYSFKGARRILERRRAGGA